MILQDLRQHFVANEVANVELGNKIMAHIAGPREYGARVEDLRLYDAVARDVIRRWTYPMVPDNSTTGIKHYLKQYIRRYERYCIVLTLVTVEVLVVVAARLFEVSAFESLSHC
jgi:translation initiation factor eIF-2B subunit epsilon